MADAQRLDQYRGLVQSAREAFSADPSYAIAMAQQASSVLARRPLQGRVLLSRAPHQKTAVEH